MAACISANEEHGPSTIVNAGDTDWIDWEAVLQQEGVIVERLIEEWVRNRWREKHKV